MGIRVPEEISIVGFDNLEFAAHLDPPLTTMEVPAAQMGERAAEFLLRRASGQSALPSIYLEPKLIVRRHRRACPLPASEPASMTQASGFTVGRGA